jgi:hypothetical protein
MKTKTIFLSFLFVVINNTTFGNLCNYTPDTIPPKQQLTKSYFLEKYSDNDNTRKFIEEWFSQRHTFSALAGLSGLGAALLTATQKSGSGNSTAIDRPFLFDPALGLAVVGAIFSVIFIIPFIAHSRKKLYRLLEKNKNGEPISKKYRKKLEAAE